ncbi:phage antirepressor N-terminal domain-containing protein [Nitrospirillum iridis]|uniref:Antirepressor protein ant N-terminal domain-containing protein n=1 Tax=Nitrospirillum iridis TaxID=765888 RepID=A0A7X0AZJ0_9PROT|nr:phage antirepressor N-terminal domain-containing protein [Nitrospirillum iridis]MBB6251439.1 hypothetical protein [Nitrospirillum iridis]
MTTMLTAVPFRDDTLLATRTDSGDVLVAVKPVCVALGLDWKSQQLRLRRDAVLSEGRVIMTLPSAGGLQEAICLPLRLMNGWLFGIDENRVRPEIRDKVIAYKRECYDVLWQHFQPPVPTSVPTTQPLSDASGGDEILELTDELSGLPYQAMRAWMDMIRLAGRLKGRNAALAMWERSPLPQLPGATVTPSAVEVEDSHTAHFAAEMLTTAEGQSVPFAAVYQAYERWCRQQREIAASRMAFSRQMRALGFVATLRPAPIRFLNVALV